MPIGSNEHRESAWSSLRHGCDLVVIGGGCTGAAILREAARVGLRAVLLEQRDFAWGTSSRSTKLAHGGLRYLDTGDVALVLESLRERERLVAGGAGLARRVPFVLASRKRDRAKHLKARVGLSAYALLTGAKPAPTLGAEQLRERVPELFAREDLVGLSYEEATIDDARLVLRLLQEAAAAGAVALNYCRVESLLHEGTQVAGVLVRDVLEDRTVELRARAVVNATGAWADRLHEGTRDLHMRPLRGSHLLFSARRVPITHGVSFRHPRDGRFVCAVPWEDATVIGTTDLEHRETLDAEPSVSRDELRYLLEAADAMFPQLELTTRDVVSCYAGVRPVLDDGKGGAPSDVSRRHLVLEHNGLVTVTGGKLTTCRVTALDALRPLRERLPALRQLAATPSPLDAAPAAALEVPAAVWQRLATRFGRSAPEVVALAGEGELEAVPGTSTLWVELRWALRHERVEHLDDLLLRRVRLGLVLEQGGAAVFERVRELCAEELGWDEARWSGEVTRYREIWSVHYAPPSLRRSATANGVSRLPLPRGLPAGARPSRFSLRRADLDGPVAYADFGGSGAPVVLVHGAGGCHLNWLPAAPMLSRHARVLALDLAGFGRTPKAGRSHGVESQRRLLDRFLTEVVQEPAVVIGNSLGGLVALMEAAASPERVAGLVLVSAAQPPTKDSLPSGVQLMRCLAHMLPGVGELMLYLEGKRVGARGLFMDLLSFGCADVSRVPPEVVEANVSLIADRMAKQPWGHATSYLEVSRSLVAHMARRRRFDAWVREVRAPTLLIHGTEDRLVSVAASRRLTELRPDWRLVELADCGHVPQMEHAARFVGEVTGWLADRAAFSAVVREAAHRKEDVRVIDEDLRRRPAPQLDELGEALA